MNDSARISALTLGLLGALTNQASAAFIDLDTSGTWQNATGGSGMVVGGEGSSSLTWGFGGSTPNSLEFTGVSDLSVETGEVFAFGTIDYYNGSVALGSEITSVDLQTSVNAQPPANGSSLDTFSFSVVTTPNVGTAEENADSIGFAGAFHDASFEVDGVTYVLEFLGFGSLDSNGFVDEITTFSVLEGQSASASAFGRLVETPTNVPELDPGASSSALMLLIGGALVLADRRRRPRRRQLLTRSRYEGSAVLGEHWLAPPWQ